ncbi:MAG: SRPBCC family protein [Solirubrobacteraceae bacterium]
MTDLIERELELPASPGAVWAALTDPTWLTEWFADEAELELWPGGEARFTIDEQTRTGWVEEATPPPADAGEGAIGRLAFWWEPDGGADGSPSRVELELIGTARGTRLRVVEARPLEVLDVIGIPLGGTSALSGRRFGPALVAA